VRIDVHFNGSSTGGQAELHDRVVLVIDVLRASTSIAAALNNGARAVIPFQGVDEAMTRARSLERSDVLLAGERKMVPIRGFDLGNSPGEFTPAVVQGKTIVMTTTNGTAALAGAQGAHEVLVGSFANYSVGSRGFARRRGPTSPSRWSAPGPTGVSPSRTRSVPAGLFAALRGEESRRS